MKVQVLVVVLLLAAGRSAAAEPESGADYFRMPSGNILCAYQHYSFAPVELRCEIRSLVNPRPPRPKGCGDAVWAAGYAMSPTDAPYVLCISDTIYSPSARTLAYGTRWSSDGFTCSSATDGLRCSNRSGNGFVLSRKHSYTFGRE